MSKDNVTIAYALYRVSTKGQVDKVKDDIPMQRLNKKGKPTYDLAIEPEEAEIVREIFDKTVKDGYGSFRLAHLLNDKGVKTHNNCKFQSNTILRILRNKLYCGYMVSGEVSSPHLSELQIIDEKVYEQAQYILNEREQSNEEKRKIALTTRSRSMLSGIMYCAHCGGRMTSITYTDRRRRKDGTLYEFSRAKYQCYHKSRGLCECDGQSSYLAYKVDDAVVKAINVLNQPCPHFYERIKLIGSTS